VPLFLSVCLIACKVGASVKSTGTASAIFPVALRKTVCTLISTSEGVEPSASGQESSWPLFAFKKATAKLKF
jgi:hypothetical protein